MASRAFLHIGTAKSGTSVLQSVLFENRHALARAGLTVPGLRPDAGFRAAVDLLGLDYAGWVDPLTAGMWDAVADVVREAPGTAVVSHELLARADEVQVDRALASLGDAEVHLLVTVRHLTRQVPSAWQEDLRNGQWSRWPDFQVAVAHGTDTTPETDMFGAYQDHPAALARWGRSVPAERVHVVGLVPGAVLWHDVAHVLGVDPAVATRPATVPVNRSLGREQAELLRATNERLAGRVGFREYSALVKFVLAAEVLERRPGRPIRLAPDAYEAVADRHAGYVRAVRDAGYDVDPRLDRLEAGRPEGAAEAAADHDLEPGLAVAADALAELVVRLAEEHYRVDPVGKARRAALDLVETHASARRALHAYLRAKDVAGRWRPAGRVGSGA